MSNEELNPFRFNKVFLSKTCCVCKKVGKDFKKCSRCRSYEYCSLECQKIHWVEHKKECQSGPQVKSKEVSFYLQMYGEVLIYLAMCKELNPCGLIPNLIFSRTSDNVVIRLFKDLTMMADCKPGHLTFGFSLYHQGVLFTKCGTVAKRESIPELGKEIEAFLKAIQEMPLCFSRQGEELLISRCGLDYTSLLK